MTKNLGSEDRMRQRMIWPEHDLTVTQYFWMAVAETEITG